MKKGKNGTMKPPNEEDKTQDADFKMVEELMMAPSPDFNDVMRCVFKIKDYEIEMYFALLEHPNSTAAEISEFLNKDRSSAQRSLQTLMDKGMIKRKFRVLDVGGFTYVYTALPLEEIKRIMEHELKIWGSIMCELVKEFKKK